jgi:integrase/recombinase XerD
MPRALDFDRACDRFIGHLKVERNLSPNTIDGYSRDLRRLGSHLGAELGDPFTVDRVESQHLVGHFLALADLGLSARTRARALVAARGLFRFLVQEHLLEDSPTDPIDSPRLGRKLPEILGVDEVDALLDAPAVNTPRGLRDRAMLATLYATGVRVSELCGMELRELNLERGYVRVTGKGRKQRLIPLGLLACDRIAAYLAGGRPHLAKGRDDVVPLFLGNRQRSMSRQGF